MKCFDYCLVIILLVSILSPSDQCHSLFAGCGDINCILTTTKEVKCWGDGSYGIGSGDSNNIGSGTGEVFQNF